MSSRLNSKSLKMSQEEMTEEQQQKKMITSISKLPKELFWEILLKLPIQTLSSCRWVSKAWLKSIKHPLFLDTYNSKIIQNPNSASLHLYLGVSEKKVDHLMVAMGCMDAFETSLTLYTPRLPKLSQPISKIYSCNGVVLIGESHSSSYSGRVLHFDSFESDPVQPYYVCNPITGDHMEVPLSPAHEHETKDMLFQYDNVSNAFKIIRVFEEKICAVDKWEVKKAYHMEIYNFGVSEWRVIGKVPFQDVSICSSICFNGVLYWYCCDPAILWSMKLDTEELLQLPLPDGFFNSIYHRTNTLVQLDDRLSFVYNVNNEYVRIWVMNGYGAAISWYKAYVIKDLKLNGNLVEGPYMPLKLMHNGEFLIICSNKTLGYYNRETKAFRPIDVNLPGKVLLTSFHVGSFISPAAALLN